MDLASSAVPARSVFHHTRPHVALYPTMAVIHLNTNARLWSQGNGRSTWRAPGRRCKDIHIHAQQVQEGRLQLYLENKFIYAALCLFFCPVAVQQGVGVTSLTLLFMTSNVKFSHYPYNGSKERKKRKDVRRHS